MNEQEACERFVGWLERCVVSMARGDQLTTMSVEPRNRLWLGRLAPESAVIALGLGDRGERLDPCAVGLTVQPLPAPRYDFVVGVRFAVWLRQADRTWRKSAPVELRIPVSIPLPGEHVFGADELRAALARVTGVPELGAEIRAELLIEAGRTELTVILVNTSPEEPASLVDPNLYECEVEIEKLSTRPFILEALPDSFRYNRRVDAYGVNCSVATDGARLRTVDTVSAVRGRPEYWGSSESLPDLRFASLAVDPLPAASTLVGAFERWGSEAWGSASLDQRAARESWTAPMRDEANKSAADFAEELRRLKQGVALLQSNAEIGKAFCMANEAMVMSSAGRYDSWRPFQLGFLIANLDALSDDAADDDFAEIVWFATGGGKTETYLGLVLTTVLYDRLRGKTGGISAWSRFPLRMLSLQQTQRFADAIAAAEVVRRRHGVGGEPFGVGFLVGQAATPNSIKKEAREGEPDPDDDEMPAKFRVLLRCPFCRNESMKMGFDRRLWRLEHRCGAQNCPWPEAALPFFVVDEEIYRFLPSVVIGTLDKAAVISMQASMRGLVGPPWGVCSVSGHGYTYAPRAQRPAGCLVPDCKGERRPLPMQPQLYGPTLRLQDELHLLRDSLGAVDAHYEALLDHLQVALCGRQPKVLGSSATLTGYEKQTDVLYRRRGRVFPAQGPTAEHGFWTSESERLARRYTALAPRGSTIEYAVDRTVTELQEVIRRLGVDPATVCREAGIDPGLAPLLLDLYGVQVVYGNTLRDLDAVTRSFETQVQVAGRLNTASLTGRTPFDEVRDVLSRLERPETAFDDRIHLIAASAMMSHGVDIDRLNIMIVLGMPLTTAEFVQATARVGRRHPGLVLVFPKMARERDAGVFRSFAQFVRQADRFVEPVPISRRSRRVLERTLPGLVMARLRHLHEPSSGASLATNDKVRDYFRRAGITAQSEMTALTDALGLGGAMDEALIEDLRDWLDRFFANLASPPGSARFPDDLSPTEKPMMSLRDVEEQAPIIGTVTR